MANSNVNVPSLHRSYHDAFSQAVQMVRAKQRLLLSDYLWTINGLIIVKPVDVDSDRQRRESSITALYVRTVCTYSMHITL